MYQVVHHELVASAKVVKLGHAINPDFKIGCMISFVPLYPYSCNPDDMMYSAESMHDRFLFGDVHMRGEYPSYALKNGNVKKVITLKWRQRMLRFTEKGCADYVGFSYYMSNAVKS